MTSTIWAIVVGLIVLASIYADYKRNNFQDLDILKDRIKILELKIETLQDYVSALEKRIDK